MNINLKFTEFPITDSVIPEPNGSRYQFSEFNNFFYKDIETGELKFDFAYVEEGYCKPNAPRAWSNLADQAYKLAEFFKFPDKFLVVDLGGKTKAAKEFKEAVSSNPDKQVITTDEADYYNNLCKTLKYAGFTSDSIRIFEGRDPENFGDISFLTLPVYGNTLVLPVSDLSLHHIYQNAYIHVFTTLDVCGEVEDFDTIALHRDSGVVRQIVRINSN